MEVYRCLNHNVVLTISGKERTVETPIRLAGQCYLLTAREPQEGQHDQCQIVKVS